MKFEMLQRPDDPDGIKTIVEVMLSTHNVAALADRVLRDGNTPSDGLNKNFVKDGVFLGVHAENDKQHYAAGGSMPSPAARVFVLERLVESASNELARLHREHPDLVIDRGFDVAVTDDSVNILPDAKPSKLTPEFFGHLSERNHPLVYNDRLPKADEPAIITVENYTKWYNLYLVTSKGVEKLDHGDEITWHDHVPNPAQIEAYAEKHGHEIDFQSMEMIVGRFVQEIEGREAEFIGATGTTIEDGILTRRALEHAYSDPKGIREHLTSEERDYFDGDKHEIAAAYRSLLERHGYLERELPTQSAGNGIVLRTIETTPAASNGARGFDYTEFLRQSESSEALINRGIANGTVPESCRSGLSHIGSNFHGVIYARAWDANQIVFSRNAAYYCIDRRDFPYEPKDPNQALLFTKVGREIRVRPAPEISLYIAAAADRRASGDKEVAERFVFACTHTSWPVRIGCYTDVDKQAIRHAGSSDIFSPWKRPEFPNAIVPDEKSAQFEEASFIARALSSKWSSLSHSVQTVMTANVMMVYGPNLDRTARALFVTGDTRCDTLGDRRYPPEIDMLARLAHSAGVRTYNLSDPLMSHIARFDLNHGIGYPRQGIDPSLDLDQERDAIHDATYLESIGRWAELVPQPTEPTPVVIEAVRGPYIIAVGGQQVTCYDARLTDFGASDMRKIERGANVVASPWALTVCDSPAHAIGAELER